MDDVTGPGEAGAADEGEQRDEVEGRFGHRDNVILSEAKNLAGRSFPHHQVLRSPTTRGKALPRSPPLPLSQNDRMT